MASTLGTTEATPLAPAAPGITKKQRGRKGPYPYWFYIPAAIIYLIFFITPTILSFYFSFTRWDLFTSTWIGLKNYVTFFNEQALIIGLRNTLIYAVMTSGLKVVLGLLLAVLLTSKIIARGYLRSTIFFPVLVSTIGVGLTFTVLMNPEQGLINKALGLVGIAGPGWLTNPSLAIFWHITLPLARPAIASVITLSLIGGLRSFDLIWAMTGGGPGFASDVIASVIYKQYQAGFYGLSTAGSVVLFLLVTAIIVPLTWWLNRHEVD
jgi:raffinose/stachyose/melibiose transport system permease protein